MVNNYDLQIFSKAEIKAASQTLELFRDRKRLSGKVLAVLRRTRLLDRQSRDGKKAKDLLGQRLAALPAPEFCLLAAFVLGDEMPALRESEILRWWDAIQENL